MRDCPEVRMALVLGADFGKPDGARRLQVGTTGPEEEQKNVTSQFMARKMGVWFLSPMLGTHNTMRGNRRPRA